MVYLNTIFPWNLFSIISIECNPYLPEKWKLNLRIIIIWAILIYKWKIKWWSCGEFNTSPFCEKYFWWHILAVNNIAPRNHSSPLQFFHKLLSREFYLLCEFVERFEWSYFIFLVNMYIIIFSSWSHIPPWVVPTIIKDLLSIHLIPKPYIPSFVLNRGEELDFGVWICYCSRFDIFYLYTCFVKMIRSYIKLITIVLISFLYHSYSWYVVYHIC